MYTTTQQPVLTDDDEQPRRRWRWLVALLLVFMIGGLVWAVRPNPHLTRAKELQKALFSPDAKNLSADQRKAMFDEYRTEMKKLTDEQKAALFEPMRQQQMADLDRYFAMSQQEKNRYLDERIDRSEKAKKDRQLKGGGAPGAAGFAGAPPPGGFGGAPPGGFGGPPGGNGKGGAPPSAEEIEKRKKQMLDRTTPEERAKMDQFRRDMDNRRRQRGLPVTTR